SGVALGKDETIPIFPVRILRVMAELLEEQCDENFDGRERASGMTGLGRGNHLDDLAPRFAADCRQILHFLRVCHRRVSSTLSRGEVFTPPGTASAGPENSVRAPSPAPARWAVFRRASPSHCADFQRSQRCLPE